MRRNLLQQRAQFLTRWAVTSESISGLCRKLVGWNIKLICWENFQMSENIWRKWEQIMLGRVRSCKIASTKMYFHHPNKKKTGKRVASPSSKTHLRLKTIYRESKTKLIWGCWLLVANAVWLMTRSLKMKITYLRWEENKDIKLFLRKCLDQEGKTP